MDVRKLGTIEVSPIGMGCMGFSHGYGEIPDRNYSIEAIRKGYAFGCTFFDTAESYGPNLLPENRGHNEKIVGEAVHAFRDKIVLATKLHLDAAEAAEKGLEKPCGSTWRLHWGGCKPTMPTFTICIGSIRTSRWRMWRKSWGSSLTTD